MAKLRIKLRLAKSIKPKEYGLGSQELIVRSLKDGELWHLIVI